MAKIYHNLATGPLVQDWSNAGLITTDNDWSGVPSIEGFRGQGIVTAPGQNPGEALTDSTQPNDTIVLANRVSPDPTIALQGSGTSDAPHIILYLDATGRENITLSFNARDIDGSNDNAVQQIAVQYRIGESGPWTNVPLEGQPASTPIIADATTGPGMASLVTPVTVVLPNAADNQAQLQIRILTTDASGADEWVGIDDIIVSGTEVAPPPTSTTPTPGDDDVTGTDDGPDTIAALSGADTLRGLNFNDFLLGNQGNDTVLGGAGDDTIWAGLDDDLVQGNEGGDLLFGNEGSDTVEDDGGANTIVGGQNSSDGADLIVAGSGANLIWGNGGSDTIDADGGANTIFGGVGNDVISSGAASDIIFGNQDNDTINGDDGANMIFGGFGNDSVLAGSGNDTIWGNEGDDTLAGGSGMDRYVFLIGSGTDQINGFDFNDGDRLDLQGQAFATGASADGDVIVQLSGGGTVELNGIAPGAFSPSFVL
jgi:RTX calcium-binding nonapeptide repeat (4 copies)